MLPQGNFVALITTKNSSFTQVKNAIKDTPRLLRKILVSDNGMNTPRDEAMSRGYNILRDCKSALAVIVMYNQTEGILKDGIDATRTSLRLKAAVVAELKAQFIEICDSLGCCENDFGMTFHCHSEGAGIIYGILQTPEFSRENGRYGKCIGKLYTYGGSVTIPGAINFIALGDIVPFLNPMNWITMLVHPECVCFVGPGWRTPLAAHAFEGPAYQEALVATFGQ